MKSKSYFTKFEIFLWLFSVATVLLAFLFPQEKNILNLISSLIGVTALIFVAKGNVIGQVLTVVFAVFYGIVSFFFNYYGEMITYLGMTAPIALISIFSWLSHPSKTKNEVKVGHITLKSGIFMIISAIIFTGAFYFILKKLGTANLIISTVSVTTSFCASYLSFLRSPFYAVAYSLNDLVLIIMWILASIENPSYIPMVMCFVMFFANDIYGFYSWRKMKKRQIENG